jgi:3-hydroxyacyl-CoA dehydrogenase
LGNVEDNLAEIKDADWVVEAVLERMDLKTALHAKIASHARPDALGTYQYFRLVDCWHDPGVT